MRRPSLLALALGVSLIGTACAGRGPNIGSRSRPTDPALLLSCARSVASERGLGEVTLSPESMELQAKSSVAVSPTSARGPAPSYDVLTVRISRAKQGLRMLVGGASYAMRQLRGGGGTSTATPEWGGTQPWERVALVRDAVLDQCGTLGK